MFTRPRSIAFLLSGFLFFAGSMPARAAIVRGGVRGPDGKPAVGAEVRAEQADARSAIQTIKTDAKGQYIFPNLPVGIYKITALVNKVPTSLGKVQTRADGAVRIEFDIRAAASGRKPKYYVWIPARSGGRWVTVDSKGQTQPDTSNKLRDQDRSLLQQGARNPFPSFNGMQRGR